MNLENPKLLRSACYINGAWRDSADIAVINPATGETIAKVPKFGQKEAREAVAAAGAALPEWSARLAQERSVYLRKWFDLMVANKHDLATILTSEQGKPLSEALAEIDYAASFIEFYAEEAKRIYGETIPSHRKDARIVAIRQPLGIIAAITPWNFPAAMITRKLGPALAAGCTAVCKPATETPLTAFALAELADQAGIPPGVINVITGKSSEIGQEWTTNPDVRGVTFTGSTEVGKILMQQASGTIKKVSLELGGNAPLIVFDDADLDAAVEGTIISKFRNMGQTCVCSNRIYVQEEVYDQYAEKLVAAVKKLNVGDGLANGVNQGPLINSAAVEKAEEHIADAVSKGAQIAQGGKRHSLGGTYFEPTVLKNVTTDTLVTSEETFGPVAPLYKFRQEADVIKLANATEFGLAAYFFSRDIGRVWRVAEALETGIVGVNTGLISTALAPFGGIKESGIGREGSAHGMDEYVEIKYILMAGI
ncbi:MAG: NAD-dependent succinate-semialdehyde dehydrogenase [Hyphomicrobiales bacterium]|nr:NAD-dependent succinate-semialdehyde dehydrogenase [Hyphomicrobiales bacterium]